MHSRFFAGCRLTILVAAIACMALLPGTAWPAEPDDEDSSAKKGEEQPAPDASDMRYDTLEDIYGEAGNKFQAAIGILNFEKPASTDPDPAAGYGIAVDDMVIEWREFYLADDNATCGASGGECAVIDMQTSNFFEGNTRMEITVLEKSPPWSYGKTNDCDFDEDTDGPEDANDCDSDGTNDLPVKATSETEIAGEIVYANHVSGHLFKAELPVSALYDVPGVLFVQPSGLDNPTVCAVYYDYDDGTGQICRNDVDPSIQGRLENCSTLFFARGVVSVVSTVLTDNKDNDGWADSNETVNMELMIANKSGIDLSGLTARLVTNDPKIECVVNPVMEIGDWAEGFVGLTGDTFTFKVADADRTGEALGPTDDYSALFSIILSANEFDAAYVPQSVILDIDLDANGGTGPITYTETFENGDFGDFTTMNLDTGRNSETASEGWRCQYSDPDWIYSNSYQQIDDCWLAASPTQAAAYFWQIDSVAAGEDARGYDIDGHSAYMGIYDVANSWWTTPAATLEAFGSDVPVNIGFAAVCETTRTIPCPNGNSDCPGVENCVGASPELSFKHQVSFMDWRHSNAGFGTSGDCGVVAVQLADTDTDGTPIGDWIKIEAFYNDYDQQRYDFWTNCEFDPTDDGNTEDDFFDESDPFRRLGPSSTCFPEFSFSNAGDTDAPYAPGNINNASEPDSGLEGLSGTGTWIESRFNLSRFRGRRLRMRFLTTALKVGEGETWEEIASWNPGPWDDGWWIDDIKIQDALTDFAIIVNDDKDNHALPGCGDTCNTVTPDLVADPVGALGAPGQVVELDAIGSSANRCVDGTLQYQFWVDGNGDNLGGNALDTLLRGWTDNPVILQAPLATSTYVVDVRCSSLVTCASTTAVQVQVECPWSNARSLGRWNDTIYAFPGYCDLDHEAYCSSDGDCAAGGCIMPYDGTIYVSWLGKATRKKTSTVRLDDGGKSKAFDTYVYYDNLDIVGFSDATVPAAGSMYWYILSPDGPLCNERGSWQNSEASEPLRDSMLP